MTSKRKPAREWECRYITPEQIPEFLAAGWVVEPWPDDCHHAAFGTVMVSRRVA